MFEPPDDSEIFELEYHDPNGLHLTEYETLHLEACLINLYDWMYDRVNECVAPHDAMKFANLMTICEIVHLDPDPDKEERIRRKQRWSKE